MARSPKAAAARRKMLELIDERGIKAAVTAAIQICEDPKAQGPAKATAAGLLYGHPH